MAIALAIAEALVSSRVSSIRFDHICMLLIACKALVWFATHFKDLAKIMSERAGVQNLHLAVNVSQRPLDGTY